MWAQTQNRYFKFDAFSTNSSAASFAQSLQDFVKAFSGSATGSLQLAWQYALGHGHPQAVANFDDTSVHPDVKTAVGTLKLVRWEQGQLGDKNSIGNYAAAQQAAHKQIDAMVGPTGAYLNEAAFDQPDWKNRFWGSNIAHLEVVKQKYDPNSLFVCRGCVGSDAWDGTGNCRATSEVFV